MTETRPALPDIASAVLTAFDALPPLSWREKLAYLTWKFSAAAQQSCPVSTSFESGFYIREIAIPAGVLFIGRVHRHGHECELVSGRIIHVTEDARIERQAPDRIHTTPGYQMVLYSLTPIVGRTRHPNPTDSRDLALLDDAFAEPLESLVALGEAVNSRLQKVIQ